MIDEQLIKKATERWSNKDIQSFSPELGQLCRRDHTHLPLRGSNKLGALTAQAASFPKELCQSMLKFAQGVAKTNPNGGRNSELFRKLRQCDDNNEAVPAKIFAFLDVLEEHAATMNLTQAWNAIMGPWMRDWKPHLWRQRGHGSTENTSLGMRHEWQQHRGATSIGDAPERF